MADALAQVTDADSEGDHEVIAVGNLILYVSSYRAIIDGKQLPLNAREFELLAVFAAQAGRVIPFETLAEEAFGASDRRAVRHLNVLVHRLRVKLAGLHPHVLETVRFRGYGLLRPPPGVMSREPRGSPMR